MARPSYSSPAGEGGGGAGGARSFSSYRAAAAYPSTVGGAGTGGLFAGGGGAAGGAAAAAAAAAASAPADTEVEEAVFEADMRAALEASLREARRGGGGAGGGAGGAGRSSGRTRRGGGGGAAAAAGGEPPSSSSSSDEGGAAAAVRLARKAKPGGGGGGAAAAAAASAAPTRAPSPGLFERKGDAPKFIETPYGKAMQSESEAAIIARDEVLRGARIYRGGRLGQSAGPEGQFWSLENPLNTEYAKKYGIPVKNAKFDFIEVAVLRPDSKFITREAPGVGMHGGGGIEVIVNAGEPKLEYFHMPWEVVDDSVERRVISKH